METAKVGMQHTDNPDAGDYHKQDCGWVYITCNYALNSPIARKVMRVLLSYGKEDQLKQC